MNRSVPFKSIFVLLPAVLATTACSILPFGKKQDSLSRVDELLDRIEHVYVDCELSNQRVQESLDKLQLVVAPEPGGDITVAFGDFTKAIEGSEKQARSLRDSSESMKRAATSFFEQWTKDLESFSNDRMRYRSQARMAETRTRFEAIVAAIEPAKAAYESFNQCLRDHALFLGYDLNPTSLGEIEDDVQVLNDLAVKLGSELSACRAAAQAYVQSASVPERVDAAKADPGEATKG